MTKKIMFFYIIIAINFITLPTDTTQNLLNTKFLSNSKKVQHLLFNCGFSKISFSTQDKISLKGLFLDQSKQKNVLGTIIFCAGFYPGTKEGMTALYALLKDQPYNFLFFDARGHNESNGSMFSYSSLKKYTSSEHQDIAAAIEWIHQYNTNHNINNNIILHGVCAGAFHAVNTFYTMKEQNHPLLKNIQGIIFDSGWKKLSEIVEPTIHAESKYRFNKWYNRWLAKPIAYGIVIIYRTGFKRHHNKLHSIEHKIKKVSCPILFIHGKNDHHVPFNQAKDLADNTPCAHCWWIEKSFHACHFLKHQTDYKNHVSNFIRQLNV